MAIAPGFQLVWRLIKRLKFIQNLVYYRKCTLLIKFHQKIDFGQVGREFLYGREIISAVISRKRMENWKDNLKFLCCLVFNYYAHVICTKIKIRSLCNSTRIVCCHVGVELIKFSLSIEINRKMKRHFFMNVQIYWFIK